jgi:hypothetical protein
VKFLEGQGASAAVAGEIGKERGDGLKGSLVLGHRNRGAPVPLTSQGLALDIRSGCIRGVVEGVQSGMFLVSNHTGANDEHLLRTS